MQADVRVGISLGDMGGAILLFTMQGKLQPGPGLGSKGKAALS